MKIIRILAAAGCWSIPRRMLHGSAHGQVTPAERTILNYAADDVTRQVCGSDEEFAQVRRISISGTATTAMDWRRSIAGSIRR